MDRRANGEGTWAKRTINGNVYYTFRKVYPEGRKEFSGKKKSEVQEKVKKYEAERKILANKKTYETFTQYAVNYVEKIASKNISASVLDSYLNIIKCRVEPTVIGNLQLGQVNKTYLDEYIKYLVDQKYARSTIEKTMRVVRHVIEYGIKEGKIRADVLDDFKAPPETRVLTPKKEVPFLDIEDMQKLYEEAKKPKYSNKSFNYEIFERRNCALFAFDGNSSIANLVQEARNGKGRARIFIYPKSAMLKAKAASLQGYVTMNASAEEVIEKIHEIEENIGTKL